MYVYMCIYICVCICIHIYIYSLMGSKTGLTRQASEGLVLSSQNRSRFGRGRTWLLLRWGVLFVAVLLIRAHCLGSILGLLILGNSHISVWRATAP